jgi:hypothetical protein
MAVERGGKTQRPAATQTDEQRLEEHVEAYGAILREGYEARKAGKPFSNEEFERRVQAIGGPPNWDRLRQKPNDLGQQQMPHDLRDFPF